MNRFIYEHPIIKDYKPDVEFNSDIDFEYLIPRDLVAVANELNEKYIELKRKIIKYDNGLWPDEIEQIIKEVEAI